MNNAGKRRALRMCRCELLKTRRETAFVKQK